jgi:hypothetical protein
MSPFMALYGYNPRADFLTLPSPKTNLADVNRRIKFLKELQTFLHENLVEAQNRYKHYADQKRTETPFKVGDKVWLLRKNITTRRPCRKLDIKRIGPFKILERIGSEAWRLELTPAFKDLHPVFHSSLLEPHHANTIPNRIEPPPPVVEIDGETEYEVEEILDVRKRGRGIQYLIKWKGYDGQDTWQSPSDVTNCADKIHDFYLRHPDKHIQQPGKTALLRTKASEGGAEL